MGERVGIHRLVAWRIRNDVGEPVAGAVVSIDGVAWPCDSAGEGRTSVGPIERAEATVEAAGHASWSGQLTVGSDNEIVLRRTGHVRITVLDEHRAPVEGADVWLSLRPTDGSALASDTRPPHGRTAVDGTVGIEAPFGDYFLQAIHPVLVHSTDRLRRMGVLAQSYRATIGPVPTAVEMHLAMPYVIGIEVPGAELHYDSFAGVGTNYHMPGNPDGAWACRRLRSRLEQEFANAKFFVAVRDYMPSGSELRYGNYTTTVWVLGHEACRRVLSPVPIADFRSPVRVSIDDLPHTEQFGALVIRVKDARGLPVEGLEFSVGTPAASWRDDVPEVHHAVATAGRMLTLPSGTYDITCEGHFESRLPGLNRQGVRIGAMEFVTVELESPVAWTRCSISFEGEGGVPLVGGVVSLRHRESSVSVATLVDSFESPLDLWLPEGTLSLRARATHVGGPDKLWECVDDAVAIVGGTLASPQRIRRTMTRISRR